MAQLVFASVTSNPISISELTELVRDETCGALVVFTGDVRNHDGGREVISLTYEVHPSASEKISVIAQGAIATADVVKVALSHRYGSIPIGETAFAVAVSAAHRESAFETCSKLVNEIKDKLPIWKYQEFADGSSEWVNST